MAGLGFPTIVLHNRADIRLIGDDIHRLGEGSPRDFARLMAALARRELIRGAEASDEILGTMRRQQYLDQVPRYVAHNPYAREFGQAAPAVAIAAKTGFYYGLRTDVGVVFAAGEPAIAYAVMTEGGSDHTFAPEAEGRRGQRPRRRRPARALVARAPGTAAAPPDRLRRRVCPHGAPSDDSVEDGGLERRLLAAAAQEGRDDSGAASRSPPRRSGSRR